MLGNSMHLSNAVAMLAVTLASVSAEERTQARQVECIIACLQAIMLGEDEEDLEAATLEGELRKSFEAFLGSS
jgi:hypothetical protein